MFSIDVPNPSSGGWEAEFAQIPPQASDAVTAIALRQEGRDISRAGITMRAHLGAAPSQQGPLPREPAWMTSTRKHTGKGKKASPARAWHGWTVPKAP